MNKMIELPTLKTLSKYQQVEKLIIQKIKSKELPVGTRLPAEVSLAKQLGTHRLTVNKALSNLVKENYLYRIHGKGTFVSDHSKIQMAKRELNKCRTIGVLFVGNGDIRHNDYFLPSYHALCMYLGQQHCILRTDEVENFTDCKDYINNNSFIEGYVIYTFNDISEEELRPFSDSIPFVLFNRHVEGKENEIPCVVADCYNSSMRMTESIIEKGCKNIIYVGRCDLISSVSRDRQAGFIKAMKKHGIYNSDMLLSVNGSGFKNGPEVVWEIKKRNLKYDAIICEGARLALGIKRYCEKEGIRLPDNIKLASLDSWGSLLNELELKLDTVVFPVEDMGIKAGRLLLDIIDGQAKEFTIYVSGKIIN